MIQKQLRTRVIENLWQHYRTYSPHLKLIETALAKKDITNIPLDHFAIIDLPGPHSGIPQLSAIFSAIGYHIQGKNYLPDKQNDFVWMSDCENRDQPAINMLPQVVVADFRLDELPIEIRKIIVKYAQKTAVFPQKLFENILNSISENDSDIEQKLHALLKQYFIGRDWPLPTTTEFELVREFNELLAWVLVYGRQPNHFSFSIHLLKQFSSLKNFNHFIVNDVQLELNSAGGNIKGGEETGIAQSSTLGVLQKITLENGDVEIPSAFVEFVWRYPRDPSLQNPFLWGDYFTGFVAYHANHVIESVYKESSS